ncbi:MAG TPA: ABC transporter ATP-binding protein [Thermoanaerobaculia bacterium]|nr:ABC transporter ATP-binding protein [Thermoanaerobaculia bacterium]
MPLPLRLTNLVKRFGARNALDGASLELRDGELLGLLGPNGAGKSTLVRTIIGRVAPDAGEVQIFGMPAPPGDPFTRESVGLVPQDLAIYEDLTARENLAVFGRYLGLGKSALGAAIDQALEWAGLQDRAKERAKTFSGGMKRRLNIAAGILHEPKILLLDEPTVGVDPQSRERMYEMIASLRQRGVSLIYTTHYMEEAERICDRIAIIDHGRVIAEGTKEELVERTIGGEREVTIEMESEPMEPMLSVLRSRGVTVDGTRMTVRSAQPALAVADVLALSAEQRIPIRDMRMEAPTLENVFLHLTGRELRE